jgi:hypothetical protein
MLRFGEACTLGALLIWTTETNTIALALYERVPGPTGASASGVDTALGKL